ncbi:MAG: CBS domain-containing protein [Pseudomonadales bacterium]|nr:CBS domain-containing protein [Pseudomonadales bacterium]
MNSEDRSTNDSGDKTWIEKIKQIFSTTPQTREDVNELLQLARESSLLDKEEFTIIEGAMEVRDRQVREVMVDRSQMVLVHASQSAEDFLPTIIQSGHSRFPVVGEDSDDILGIIHAKDFLPMLIQKNEQSLNIHDYLRPIHKVPESKRLINLLKDFRETRKHMAIVFDEYGGVSGLITIEDVLEEIVGEIEDEFDVDDSVFIKPLGDRSNDFIINALTPIEDFNQHFKSQLSESEFDTIAGLITQQAGHLPQRGEYIQLDQFKFKVLHADNRRLHLLRMTRLSDLASNPAE